MSRFFCLFIFLFFAAPLYAAELASFSEGDLNVQLVGDDDSAESYLLNIRADSGATLDTNVFVVENPTRVVIDVRDFRSKKARKVNLGSNNLKSLRTGVHQDKIRLVLDCSSFSIPSVESFVDGSSSQLTVRVSFDNSSGFQAAKNDFVVGDQLPPAQRPKTPPPTPIEVKPSNGSNMAKAAMAKARANRMPEIVPKEPVAEEPIRMAPTTKEEKPITRKATSAQKLEPKKPLDSSEMISLRGNKKIEKNIRSTTVKGIFFKSLLGNANSAIMLDVESIPEYKLSQRKPTVYELIVKNSKLGGSHLSLPQFPPETFIGFEVVVARQRNNDVAVMIYVEDDVKLEPFSAKGKLWVKVVSP